MKVIKMQVENSDVDFSNAKSMANDTAQEELGDFMTVAFYNNQLKLVSPHDIKCAVEEGPNCGADSYAKGWGADLEVDIGSEFKFYFRRVEDYLS